MTESVQHMLDSMTPTLKQLFERALYGVTDTNSAIQPAQFFVLDEMVPRPHHNANIFRQIPCQPAGQSTTTSNYLLLYDHSDDTSLSSLSHEEVLRLLSQLFPAVQWHHGPKLTNKIGGDCVIDALTTFGSEKNSNVQGSTFSGTGEEEDHTQPHEYYEAGQSGYAETNRTEEVVEGTGSLAEADYLLQMPNSRLLEKELLEKGKQFLESAREVPLPTSGEGLTPQQLIDVIAARRERITAAINLLKESDSLTKFRAQAVQSLKDHLERTEKWVKDHGFDIQAHRKFNTAPTPRIMKVVSDVNCFLTRVSQSKDILNRHGRSQEARDRRTKRDSQPAAAGNLGSATADASNSAILATAQPLKDFELKTKPKELEEQGKRLGRTEENVEEGVFEGRVDSQ
ncbi:hypothetical protein FRC01_012394 [Tulasnella sp. 417]|nr:hypothetical protein FRC01_012394 [Tulasnella sp. 417]